MPNVYGQKVRVIQPFASAARTATANADGSAMAESFDEAIVMVNVTAVSGAAPTLDMRYQVSPDDGTTWFTRSSVAQITATGTFLLTIPDNVGKFFRLRADIAGTTPSFTFAAWVDFKRTGEG